MNDRSIGTIATTLSFIVLLVSCGPSEPGLTPDNWLELLANYGTISGPKETVENRDNPDFLIVRQAVIDANAISESLRTTAQLILEAGISPFDSSGYKVWNIAYGPISTEYRLACLVDSNLRFIFEKPGAESPDNATMVGYLSLSGSNGRLDYGGEFYHEYSPESYGTLHEGSSVYSPSFAAVDSLSGAGSIQVNDYITHLLLLDGRWTGNGHGSWYSPGGGGEW